eukprot:TRINITY_DN14850_c0_g1_i3.p1 TRINITY_DN14850_c0_g1~~TRINITY_DN14850_c0_g1_i3.p1  ORF type:complete len:105 (-),score=14.00 TRINITY_DN14850_c0_g1_i3:2-316(-)
MSGLWHASSSKYLSSCKARKTASSRAHACSSPLMTTSSAAAEDKENQINNSLMTMMTQERRFKASLSYAKQDIYDDESLGIPLEVIKVHPAWRHCNTHKEDEQP